LFPVVDLLKYVVREVLLLFHKIV